jgi:copper chaperone CopZ
MTCQSCVRIVTGEIKKVDSKASVRVDISTQTISVESEEDANIIASAIESAGYPIVETR